MSYLQLKISAFHDYSLRLLIVIFVLSFLVAPLAKAVILIPYFNITIVKNSIGDDAVFDFDLRVAYPYDSFSQQFQIQTQSGSGSHLISAIAGAGTNFVLTEKSLPGWQNREVVCQSSNPQISVTNVAGGVSINAYPFSSVVCTFTNQKESSKTPILIVPGVLGSEFTKDNDLIWADILRMLNPLNNDSFMDPLQFKNNLALLDTSLVLQGVIKSKTQTVGNKIITLYDYTQGLITELINQGYTEGKDLFTFPYDWRYGVSGLDSNGHEINVEALKGQIDYIVNQTDAGKATGKVDIIAHSTGGLIVKRYVQEHPIDHHIGKAVMVGVPNLGAPKAYKTLINGDNFGVPGLNSDEMKKLAQNMPVVYDLAPNQTYYDQIGSFFHINNLVSTNPISIISEDLNYDLSVQEFNTRGLINNQALVNSNNVRTSDFDNFDLRTTGIDLYNIIGCKTATFGKFTESLQNGFLPNFDFPTITTGDSTVPLLSAQSIAADPNHVFFIPKTNHGDLLSANGSRQEIVNILAATNLDTSGKVLTLDQTQQNPNSCQIKGESIKIKSPVAIDVVDQSGNHSGLTEAGDIENLIPGADYEIWGEHKYVFLPTDENQQYDINLKGTGNGTFTLQDESIDNGQTTQMQVFSNLPVTTTLIGNVVLSNQTTLNLDNNGDGIVDQIIIPSAILNPDQSSDLLPPVTTASLSGAQGQSGFYRSDVSLALPAIDDNSGILKTQYNLDNSGYQDYWNQVNVSSEGAHSIKFYSTDKAGNNETEQTVNFTIDKTTPELSMQFDPSVRDLKFSSTDALVFDNDDIITATDQAGNTTEMRLTSKNRKMLMTAIIKSLAYNGTPVDISKNRLAFVWKYDSANNLKMLSQNIQSKKNFNIFAFFDGKNTSLLGLDQSGLILKSIKGLDLLKVTTNKGDLNWSY